MMRTLPAKMLHLLNPFVPLFSKRVWSRVRVLLVGAILLPGERTVSSLPCGSWARGTLGGSIATTASSTAPYGRAEKRAVCFRNCSLGRFCRTGR